MEWLTHAPVRAGVRYLSPPGAFAAQELAYVRIREREGRLFTDDVVAALPRLPPGHALADEWRLRADSAQRLARYASTRFAGRTVLDLGCGNGWLANVVAQAAQTCEVLGLDTNQLELEQAARVFGGPRVQFAYGDVFSPQLRAGAFDAIVAASAIQYFPDLPALIERLLALLGPAGELHVLDSPLYTAPERAAAEARTRAYYAALDLPAPTHYSAHLWSDVAPFRPRALYDPRAAPNRLARKLGAARSPFAWLCITRLAA